MTAAAEAALAAGGYKDAAKENAHALVVALQRINSPRGTA